MLGVGVLAAGGLLSSWMYLWGEELIRLLFGPNYADSTLPARILFLSVPMMYLNMLATTLAMSMRRERGSAVVLGLCVALNIALNTLWIPRLGTAGAAWATVVSQGLLLVLMLGLTLGPLLSTGRAMPADVAEPDVMPPALP